MDTKHCEQCDALRADLAAMAVERAELLRVVGALMTQNAEYAKREQESKPRKIQVGDRVKANQTAGFHKGAEGVVQFVEPSYDRVWVLRDRSSGPVFYHPSELDVLVRVEDVEMVKE